MLIVIDRFEREVDVEVVSRHFLKGTVGSAKFLWDSQYKLPLVYIGGKKIQEAATRKMVAAFVLLFVKELRSPKKSPIHIKATVQTTPEDSRENYAKQGISGVPYWMWRDHKVWHLCADGKYWRKTRFKEESRELVMEWLPKCSSCIYRQDCERMCSNPDVRSKEGVAVLETA